MTERLHRTEMVGKTLSHYRVLEPLGRGGMGEVFVAEDLRLRRKVALKVLPEEVTASHDRRERFEREARAVAALSHPNILAIHEFGEDAGVAFAAMELLEGETLRARIDRGALPPRKAVEYARRLADGLAAAHERGIVHRDLKPENVFVTRDDQVKILDFGLAQLRTPADSATATRLTEPGAAMGTVGYAAPEQVKGTAADARADIFALGAVLYEMLAGQRAFRGPSSFDVLMAIVNDDAPPLHMSAPNAAALESIVRRCLEKSPDQRFQSARDLGFALDASLASSPTTRPRAYWLEIRIAAAALIVVAFAGVVWWQQRTQAKPLTDKDVLVLADFANTTGDPVFDGTLRQALALHLEQSPFLKIMEDEVVRQDLRLMGRPAGEPLTTQIAHDICVREGAAATIGGSIASLGKTYVITLQAVTCQTGATLAREQAQAEDKEQVLQAIGTAATAMRAKLGESLASIEKSSGPLGQFTTSSLEALQTYAMGYALQSQGQFLKAIPFFERATELDPNFAVAYFLLSIAYNNAGDLARSNEYQRKAFSLVDRVSEFERLFISARYYWQVTGESNKAIDLGGLLARSYPRYWGVHSELSVLYRSIGQFEKALDEGQEAIRLAPRLEPPYRNQAIAYMRLDRFRDAKQVLAQARAQHLDGPRLHQRLLEIAYLEDDEVAVDTEIHWYADKPEEYLSFGVQAVNAAALGQRRKAGELYRRARETALRRGLAGVAADFDEGGALTEALMGHCQPAGQLGGPPLALALCGDAPRAEKLAAETSRKFPNGTIVNEIELPTIRAAIELKRDQPGKAIELLASALPYERAWPEAVYLRGLAYLRLRQSAQATVEFRKILDHKGASWTLDGSGPASARALVHSLSYLVLARAVALSGDTDAAKKAYENFLTLWKNADADLPVLAEVHKELAALR